MRPHAIMALAWLSKLVSLRCRCCRTADGTMQRRSELDFIPSTLGSSAQMGERRVGLRIRPGGHITSLGDLANRPRHNLSAGTPMGVYHTSGRWWASRRDCVLWVKCTTSAECKTKRLAVSTVKDDISLLFWMEIPVFSKSLLFPRNLSLMFVSR